LGFLPEFVDNNQSKTADEKQGGAIGAESGIRVHHGKRVMRGKNKDDGKE
jgi:hypothetical protein